MQILFITSGSIGDAIIASGILAHLLDTNPTAEFTLAAGPAAAPLFAGMPRLNRVVTVRKQKHHMHWFELWNETCHQRWDIIVDLRGSLLSFFLRADKRFIFMNPDKQLSKAEQLAALMQLPFRPAPRLWATPEAKEQAQQLLPIGKEIIVIAPRTNSTAKDWPIERFSELMHSLRQPNRIFVLLASQEQQSSLAPLLNEDVIDLSGKTDLMIAFAVMQRAQLFIGCDSGLLHMAAAAGIKCIGLYGSSNDKVYAPRGEKIRIITAREFRMDEKELRDPQYIQQISVEKVAAAAQELLSASATSSAA